MIWIELGAANTKHGGAGWELGKCLWCPSSARNGSDRYRSMKLAVPGEPVWHTARRKGDSFATLVGRSFVAESYRVVETPPPDPEVWTWAKSFLRIELSDYTPLVKPVDLREFAETYESLLLTEVTEKKLYYPFSTHGADPLRLTQGLYLGCVTENLDTLLSACVGIEISSLGDKSITRDFNEEYVELKRRSRERHFFSRNPLLVRAAKATYGYVCCCCGFDFEKVYGELGKNYIECHHLNPLSEREERDWTTFLLTSLSEVCVLCANCHRMIHRRRKTLSLEELQTIINLKGSYS